MGMARSATKQSKRFFFSCELKEQGLLDLFFFYNVIVEKQAPIFFRILDRIAFLKF